MLWIPEQSESVHVKFAASTQPEDEGSKSKQAFCYFVNEGDGCRLIWRDFAIVSAGHFLAALHAYLMISHRLAYLFIFSNISSLFNGIGVTGGAHRLWSHRAYKAKWPLRVLLMVMQTMSGQSTIWTWCEFHRVHHKYTDTDADPYNARRGMFYAHASWIFMRLHPEYYVKLKGVDMSDLAKDPIVMLQKRFYWPLHVLFAIVLPTLLPMTLWGESLAYSLLATTFTITIHIHLTALINSAAHLFGEKPFKVTSAGDFPLSSAFALGEGYHNYHHTFPRDYGAAELGSTFNLTKFVIDLMAGLGQTYDLKTTSRSVVDATRAKMSASRTGHAHAHEEAPDEDYETVRSSKSV